MKKMLFLAFALLIMSTGCGAKEKEVVNEGVKVEKPVSSVKVGIQKGNMVPDFDYYGVDGGRFKFQDLRGKYVILHFWATWCPPCKREMPEIEELYKRSIGTDLELVAISVDRGGAAKGLVENYMKDNGYTMPMNLDKDSELGNKFLVKSIPTTFIINDKGIIVNKIIGATSWKNFDVDLLKVEK